MMAREERQAYGSSGVAKNIRRSAAPPPPPPPTKCASSIPPPPSAAACSVSIAPPPPPVSTRREPSIPPPPPPAAFVQDYGRIHWPGEPEPSTNWSIGVLTSHPRQYTVKDILDDKNEGVEFLTANYAFDDDVLNEQLGDIEFLTERYSYDD